MTDEIPQARITACWKILLAADQLKAPDSAFDSVLEIHEAAADYWSHVQFSLQFAMDQGDNKYRQTVRDGAAQLAARCLVLLVHMTDESKPGIGVVPDGPK